MCAKRLYTGFEGYWANKTSDLVVAASEVADFWNPLRLLSNSPGDVQINFDSGARSLTGTRGSYLRITHESLTSNAYLATDHASFSGGYSLGFFFKFDSLPVSATTNVYISCNNPQPNGGTYQNAVRYDHTPGGTSLLVVGSNSGGNFIPLPFTLSAGVWYYCAIKCVPGVSFSATLNGETCVYSSAGITNQLTYFNVKTSGAEIARSIDDICLNDSSGIIDNDIPSSARFFNATLNATDGTLSGWICSPTGPTPQSALRDGTDTNTVISGSSGQVVGEVLPDVSALYPSALRVVTLNFAMKNVIRDNVTSPSLSTRINTGLSNTDVAVGPGLATGNYFVPTFYKTGTTEFTISEFNSSQAQLIST